MRPRDWQPFLDEYYYLNKKDPNYSLCRATVKCGEDAHTDGKFNLSDKAAMEIMRLFFTPDEQLYDKRITDFFDDEVLNSNFWLYWRTMFAFENWHSALEMKLYLKRYIHHVGGLPDFTALRFTKYNQYESMILPMVRYLESHGVQFHYNTKVVNVEFEIQPHNKLAKRIELLTEGEEKFVDLTENDLVFITNGGCVENATMGSQNEPAAFNPEIKPGGGWDMWRKIAAQDPSFGHPDKFCHDPEQSNWMSATVETLDQRIIPYIKKICKRDPFSGGVVTGGIVTVKDSSWLMSWTINRQPQFRNQPEGHCLVWVYGLFSDKPGDYIQKPMRECSGKEICMEWLYHLGVPENQIEDMAEHSANTVPVMMPYITAFFMPRAAGDRPDVVPAGAINFAFPGPVRRDQARHHLHHRVFHAHRHGGGLYASEHRPRRAGSLGQYLRHPRPTQRHHPPARRSSADPEMNLPLKDKLKIKGLLDKIEGTDIEKLLKEYHVVE